MIFSWLWFAKHVELSLIFYYIKGLLSFLILYQEKDDRMKSNPDLYFNCATVSFSSLSLSLSLCILSHVGEDFMLEKKTSCDRESIADPKFWEWDFVVVCEDFMSFLYSESCPFMLHYFINMKSINMLLLAIHCSITHMFCTYMVELLFLGQQISRELWEGP